MCDSIFDALFVGWQWCLDLWLPSYFYIYYNVLRLQLATDQTSDH